MEKFTEGPWSILPIEDDKEYIRIRGTVLGGRYKIADVHDLHFVASAEYAWVVAEREESKANAALIAAAPEMYDDIKRDIDWLKQMRSFFVIGSDGFRACSLRIESKQKLLAKARGEQ